MVLTPISFSWGLRLRRDLSISFLASSLDMMLPTVPTFRHSSAVIVVPEERHDELIVCIPVAVPDEEISFMWKGPRIGLGRDAHSTVIFTKYDALELSAFRESLPSVVIDMTTNSRPPHLAEHR